MMASRAPHFLAATAVLAALCAPAAAAINAPVFVAQLPIFSGGECTTSVAGSAAFSCANMRAQANTWSATQTIANVTSPGTVQGAQVTSTNNMTAAGTVTAGGALKAGAATITSSGIDVTGISIFRSAVTAPTPVANDNSTNVDTTANSQNRLSRVANAAALAAWANTAFPVERDGFATPGDGGRARYNWSSAACTAADGGSQITATAGGCWGIDTIGQTSVRVFGVLGQGDDSAAWAAALAWSGNTHHTLIDDVAQSILYANTRQLLTANATLVGGSSLEGADGTYYTNLPSVYFNGSGTGGGWTLGNNVTISGINFYSTTVDHCLEWTGKFDLENVQLDCPTSGGITTLNVVVGTAFTNNVNSGPFVNLGLTNGTYTKIPFTGSGGGSGATVTVVVSGGAITTVTPDGAGTVGAPYFIFGFASGALYSGSPTIASAGYFATANPGRSRIHNVYTVCESKYGLDVDGAFDFVDVTGLEYWCGAFKANAAAFHFGRIDGLTMSNQKVFGANIGVLSDGPGFFGGSFATFGNGAHDLVNTGYFLQTPLNNASIHGGFIRALSNAVLINNAGTNFVETGVDTLANGGVGTYIDNAAQATIVGNSYHRAAGQNQQYIYVSPDAALTTAQNVAISGDTFDLNGPAIYVGTNAGQVTSGVNAWPANSTYAYMTTAGSPPLTQMPTHGGQVTVALTSGGVGTIPHGLGSTPQQPSVSLIGGNAPGYYAAVTSVNATAITVTVYNRSTGATAPAGNYAMVWGG